MVSVLLSAPVLVKVIGSLGLILIINLLRVQLVYAIPLGTLALALWCGHSASVVAGIAGHALIDIDTVMLLLVIYQVIGLSAQMEAAGVMRELVAALRQRFSHRAAIAMLPAVIGFLPMPGGALFSAPLVDRCDTTGAIAPLLKTQINYWFRHVWEFWWPLYPGVLLAMTFTHLEVWQVMVYGLPLTLTSITAGYYFLLRHLPINEEKTADEVDPTPQQSLFTLLLPIIVVVVGYALVRLAYAVLIRHYELPAMNRYFPMTIGLLAATLALQARRPLPRAQWKTILTSRKTLSMMMIILSLQVYAAFVDARLPDGNLLMTVMNAELHRWGIPLMAVYMLIPFISGITTGVAFGFVGASFPIVFNLLGAHPAPATVLATAALAYGCGFIGMMLSPIHVCFIVTAEHFHTSLYRSLPRLLSPTAVLLGMIVLLYLTLHRIALPW